MYSNSTRGCFHRRFCLGFGAKDCTPEIDTSGIIVDFQRHSPMASDGVGSFASQDFDIFSAQICGGFAENGGDLRRLTCFPCKMTNKYCGDLRRRRIRAKTAQRKYHRLRLGWSVPFNRNPKSCPHPRLRGSPGRRKHRKTLDNEE